MKFIVQKGGTGWNVFAQRYELIQTWHASCPTLESANSYRDKLEKDTREGLIYLGDTIDDGQKRVSLTRKEFEKIFDEVDTFGDNVFLGCRLLDKIFGEEPPS